MTIVPSKPSSFRPSIQAPNPSRQLGAHSGHQWLRWSRRWYVPTEGPNHLEGGFYSSTSNGCWFFWIINVTRIVVGNKCLPWDFSGSVNRPLGCLHWALDPCQLSSSTGSKWEQLSKYVSWGCRWHMMNTKSYDQETFAIRTKPAFLEAQSSESSES